MPHDSPGLFVHAARPAEIGSVNHPDQHYFGHNGHHCVEKRIFGTGVARATVLRFTEADTAKVIFESNCRGVSSASIDINLTADELQMFACALLDAAHELRTQPAVEMAEAIDGGAA